MTINDIIFAQRPPTREHPFTVWYSPRHTLRMDTHPQATPGRKVWTITHTASGGKLAAWFTRDNGGGALDYVSQLEHVANALEVKR